VDYENLVCIRDKGLLVRRINIRQVMVFQGAAIAKMKRPKIDHRLFENHKRRIRESVDTSMLRAVFPVGAVIRGVLPEYSDGMVHFGTSGVLILIPVGTPLSFKE
jgi:radical SAM superfamily enzyme with C-terminal helix-hairpin-helix motif